jgi:hypothetical protein
MLDKIDRCMCGAVQGFFYLKDEKPPFTAKQLRGVHSPLGCFRQGGKEEQVADLYKELTGLWPYGIEYWVQLQVVFSRLKDKPERAQTLPVVLSPTPLIPPRAYEISPPARLRARGGTGGPGGDPVTPARLPVTWSESSGRVKPPWEK